MPILYSNRIVPMVQEIEKESNFLVHFVGDRKPFFSAFECGKLAIVLDTLERENKFYLVRDSERFQTLYEEYMNNTKLDFLPVFDSSNEIIGYTMREKTLAALSKGRFSKELLLRPEVTVSKIVDKRITCIDAYTSLPETSRILMQRDDDIRFDPFVITLDGQFYGVCSIQKILDGLNRFLETDIAFCDVSQKKLMHETNYQFKQLTDVDVDYRVKNLHGPGGDYVGTFAINPNLMLFVHFDVCGKGLKASNVVMVLGSILKTWIEQERQRQPTQFRLADKVKELNRLSYSLTADDMYATGVFVLYDKINQTVQIYDYGHGLIWLKRKNKAIQLSGLVNNPQEGRFEKMPFFAINEEIEINSIKFRIKKGDMIFTCTDGIVEQKDVYKEEFSTNRLEKLLAEYVGFSPIEMNDLVIDEWNDFRKQYKVLDDYSILSIAL